MKLVPLFERGKSLIQIFCDKINAIDPDLKAEIDNTNTVMLDNESIGFIRIAYTSYNQDNKEKKNWVYVEAIELEEKYRGKGLGLKIYQALLDAATEKGAAGLVSYCFDDNTGQQRSPDATRVIRKLLAANTGTEEEVDEKDIEEPEEDDDIPFYGPPFVNYYITKK